MEDLLATSGFLIFIFFSVSPVVAVLHNGIDHVGCYKTNMIITQPFYYVIDGPLSWEDGLAACDKRYATHVGFQAGDRNSSIGYFFCGNDLLDHSIKLEDSTCVPCVDSTDRYCGGPQAMSVYKLRESTPLVIYIATANGIDRLVQINESYSNYSNIFQTSQVFTISLSYSYDEVVYSNNSGKLWRSYLGSPQTSSPYEISTNTFAVDWVEKLIYYCTGNNIMEYSMDSKETKAIYEQPNMLSCKQLTIDPYVRTLFIVYKDGSLSSLSLLNKKLYTYTGGKYKPHAAKRIAVDHHNQLIYVIASLSADNKLSLVTFNYADDAPTPTVVFQGPEIQMSGGLDVFNNSVVWVNHYSSGGTIYICRLSPTCENKNLKVLRTGIEDVEEITIYHPQKQTPPDKYLCEKEGCSHNCTRVSLFVVECFCPEGLTLRPDNRTCEDVETTKSSDSTPPESVTSAATSPSDVAKTSKSTSETHILVSTNDVEITNITEPTTPESVTSAATSPSDVAKTSKSTSETHILVSTNDVEITNITEPTTPESVTSAATLPSDDAKTSKSTSETHIQVSTNDVETTNITEPTTPETVTGATTLPSDDANTSKSTSETHIQVSTNDVETTNITEPTTPETVTGATTLPSDDANTSKSTSETHTQVSTNDVETTISSEPTTPETVTGAATSPSDDAKTPKPTSETHTQVSTNDVETTNSSEPTTPDTARGSVTTLSPEKMTSKSQSWVIVLVYLVIISLTLVFVGIAYVFIKKWRSNSDDFFARSYLLNL